MESKPRRTFIKQAGLAGMAAMVNLPAMAFAGNNNWQDLPYINFTRDGLDFSTADYAAKLVAISERKGIAIDSYSNHGVVAELEKKMAAALGKEAAVYMPTGTLANHIAIRKLAGDRTRVLVQAESHIYNDSGDTVQVLSNLNLIPLNPGSTNFSLADVEARVARAEGGRVKTGVGVIAIESPVRRTHNEVFSFTEMKQISAYARAHGIGMHLDGARLFNAPPHTGIGVKAYTALFDTVYISLYKDFNAASGAILAGTAEFCRDLYHTRRMFGGSMPNAWPFAAVALEYIDSFLADYTKSLARVKAVFGSLSEKYQLQELPNGTNVMQLRVLQGDPATVRKRLLTKNIRLNEPATDFTGFYVKINPSVLRVEPKLLVRYFTEAAS